MINADLKEFFTLLGIEPTLSLCHFIWEGENGRIVNAQDYRCLVTAEVKIFYDEETIAEAMDAGVELPVRLIELTVSETPLAKTENPGFEPAAVWSARITPEVKNGQQFVSGQDEDNSQILLNHVKGLRLIFSGTHESEDQD